MPAQRLPCRDSDRDSLGLRSLLVADAAGGCGGGRVVTRTIVAVHQETTTSCNGECNGCSDEEEDVHDGEDGCWVAYGRRGMMRRLPPPLPSLRGAMRRTRTKDGRLVVTEEPAGARRRHEYIRARRRGGRVTMQLVESKDFYPCSSPAEEEEDDDIISVPQAMSDTSTTTAAAAAVGECDRGHMQKAPATAPPPPSPPSIGCFEDVVKYHSIGSTSLHQIVRLRMVH
uniref:FAF domain-containing protein n=1 Tax=Oryza meridionalis TaxID=40149 RepID=A0A0E0CRK0_9ORYZ